MAEKGAIQVLSQLDPTTARTNSIADLRLCMGLASGGHRVELIVPAASAPDDAQGIFELYGIEPSFDIRYVASPPEPNERRRMARLVRHHGKLALSGGEARVVISRDVRLLVPYLSAARLPASRLLAVPWLHEFRDRPLERWVCRKAACVLATNSAIVRSLESRGVGAESTFVTGNPVPRTRVEFGRSCSREEARERVGLDPSRQVVAYTGKLYKGMRELDYLLAAARCLPEALFVLTGGQPGVVAGLERELFANGMSNVHLTGLLPSPEDIRFYQQAADVLVSYYSRHDHPYAHHNLPNKLAEYMTTGNPVVSADFPAVRDLLHDGNSILVAPEEPERLVAGIQAALGAGSSGLAMRAQAKIAAESSEAVGARVGAFLARRSAPVVRAQHRRSNVAAIISNEIIALELSAFLERHYGSRQGEAVLDLGAGTKPYAALYEPYFGSSTSVDVDYSPHDTRAVDTLASADALPFGDGSFDCVVCTEVLEHCRRPQVVLGEIFRVLRPGGRLFLSTPFLRPLHEMPHDYFRFTPSSLRGLAEDAG
ncbi:MAG TPA: methyltransferase domain-containing protein, partial [Thermoleophilaceae bacterium]|nr:methyltransferase domain-containing protein [Thermoleophilaceae bacterium]